MTTSFIAMGIALLAVVGLVIGIGALSLLMGAGQFIFGGPKFQFLKSEKGLNGLAFAFNWNSAKEPARIDYIQLRLFNALGAITQKTVSVEFPAEKNKFAKDVDLGKSVQDLLTGAADKQALVEVEIGSRKDGIQFKFPFRGNKFLTKKKETKLSVTDFNKDRSWDKNTVAKSPIGTPQRNFIADTVPGKGNQLAIPTNPAFAEYFSNVGGGSSDGASAAGEGAANFTVTKTWIEDGCIVCNACEDIYPEVFEVKEDTCIIRPGAPLDDGLKIEEAAEACPVEVIKFTKAG